MYLLVNLLKCLCVKLSGLKELKNETLEQGSFVLEHCTPMRGNYISLTFSAAG